QQYFNSLVHRYQAEQAKARGAAGGWDNDKSIETIFALAKLPEGLELPVTVMETVATPFLGYLESIVAPYQEAEAQRNWRTQLELDNAVGDPFGDAQLFAELDPGYKAAIEPTLATYLGTGLGENFDPEQAKINNPLLTVLATPGITALNTEIAKEKTLT